ncbi:MAG: signal peptidase I [Moraxellaceae bacterium]|nr:signal peptidase I [Pseudobdellovibrionaceae bacterium]
MQTKKNIYWILFALIAALFFRTFLISVHKIPTVSMAPTFWPGDYIMSSQVAYGLHFPWSKDTYFKSAPGQNDLIVFQFTSQKAASKSSSQYVKRIVAIEGDEIEMREGHLILNGQPCSYKQQDQALSVESFQIFEEVCAGSKRDIVLSKQKNQGELDSMPKIKIPVGEVFVLGDNRGTSDDSRNLGTVSTDQIASKVSSIWLSYGSTQDFISGPNQIRWNRILTKPR